MTTAAVPEQAIPTARERVMGDWRWGESFLTLSFSITRATAAGCQRLLAGTRRSCSSSEVGGAPRNRHSSDGSSCCRMMRRSPTRGLSRSASIHRRSRPRSRRARGPLDLLRTRIATSSLSWVFARRPTPSTIRTCPRCSWLTPNSDPLGVQRLLVLGEADSHRARARPPRVHPDASYRLGRPDAVSRCWLALIEEPAPAADAAAPASTLDGRPAGTLAAWRQRAKPVRHALRVDERMIDAAGSPALIFLVLPPPGVRLPFDDLAVQQARRRVLADPFPDAVSTLLRDDSHFEGAITVARSPADKHRLTCRHPFGRIFPARILAVDSGMLGSTAAPTGPTIERYGSGNPWPWDQFS